VQERKK